MTQPEPVPYTLRTRYPKCGNGWTYLLVAAMAVACGRGAERPPSNGDIGTSNRAIIMHNGLPPKGLGDLVTFDFEENLPNGPTALTPEFWDWIRASSPDSNAPYDFALSAVRRRWLTYVVRCAAPQGYSWTLPVSYPAPDNAPQAVSPSVQLNAEEVYQGAYGLLPDWWVGGDQLSSWGARMLLSCLGASTNPYGATVMIDLRGLTASGTPMEEGGPPFSAADACFFATNVPIDAATGAAPLGGPKYQIYAVPSGSGGSPGEGGASRTCAFGDCRPWVAALSGPGIINPPMCFPYCDLIETPAGEELPTKCRGPDSDSIGPGYSVYLHWDRTNPTLDTGS